MKAKQKMAQRSAVPETTTTESSAPKPADQILDLLESQNVYTVRALLAEMEISAQDSMDAIEQLESFGLVQRDKDADGNAIVRSVPGA